MFGDKALLHSNYRLSECKQHVWNASCTQKNMYVGEIFVNDGNKRSKA